MRIGGENYQIALSAHVDKKKLASVHKSVVHRNALNIQFHTPNDDLNFYYHIVQLTLKELIRHSGLYFSSSNPYPEFTAGPRPLV